MCNAASFYVLQHGVYWSKDSDSHTDIRSESNLPESSLTGPLGVSVEMLPPYDGADPCDFNNWKYKLDVGLWSAVPRWYDEDDCEARCRQALPEWAHYHTLETGFYDVIALKSRVVLNGGVEIAQLASSRLFVGGESRVVVRASANSVITVAGHSRVEICHSNHDCVETVYESRCHVIKHDHLSKRSFGESCLIAEAMPV